MIEPRSPAAQADSLPAEPQEKPKNTGVGSLCLLQRIFPTQQSNRGLLPCRWILYQASHQEIPGPNLNYLSKDQPGTHREAGSRSRVKLSGMCFLPLTLTGIQQLTSS